MWLCRYCKQYHMKTYMKACDAGTGGDVGILGGIKTCMLALKDRWDGI